MLGHLAPHSKTFTLLMVRPHLLVVQRLWTCCMFQRTSPLAASRAGAAYTEAAAMRFVRLIMYCRARSAERQRSASRSAPSLHTNGCAGAAGTTSPIRSGFAAAGLAVVTAALTAAGAGRGVAGAELGRLQAYSSWMTRAGSSESRWQAFACFGPSL